MSSVDVSKVTPGMVDDNMAALFFHSNVVYNKR